MSRIRSIKPEWLDDELLATASPEARTLSVALICLADDYGNGRAGRVQLASRVFPGMPLEIIDAALAELVRIRYVHLYDVDGQRYFSLRTWDKHQRVDKPGLPKVPRPNLAATTGNDTGNPPLDNSQECPANVQESPDESRPSCASPSSPISESPIPSPASSDRPEDSGSARTKSKPRAKSEHAPFLMHDGWMPPAELVASLAASYSTPAARVEATTPEFRYFWKQRGDRKKQTGWERAFSSNVERLAARGALYVLAPGSSPTSSGPPPDLEALNAANRAKAAAVEAKAKAQVAAGRPS